MATEKEPPKPEDGKPADTKTVSRSDFLQAGIMALGAVGATAAALEPLKKVDDFPSFDEFFQKHYKELSKEDMAGILERTRKQVKEKYGVDAKRGEFRLERQ